MDSITIRLPEETLGEIKEEAERRDISKSEVIREWFREREELQSECEQLRSECEQLQTECDRLQNEKRMILEQREETTELVHTAERQQDWIERQARAGLLTKTKWAIFGMPDENED